jgi:hypothetical protein
VKTKKWGEFWKSFNEFMADLTEETPDLEFDFQSDGTFKNVKVNTFKVAKSEPQEAPAVVLSAKGGEAIKGEVNGWKLDAVARANETLTIEVKHSKLTERRVRIDPDGRRVETTRVIERPASGHQKQEAKASDAHKGSGGHRS